MTAKFLQRSVNSLREFSVLLFRSWKWSDTDVHVRVWAATNIYVWSCSPEKIAGTHVRLRKWRVVPFYGGVGWTGTKWLVLTFSRVILMPVADAPQHTGCAGCDCQGQWALISFVQEEEPTKRNILIIDRSTTRSRKQILNIYLYCYCHMRQSDHWNRKFGFECSSVLRCSA